MTFSELKIGDRFSLSVMDQLFRLPSYIKVAEHHWNAETVVNGKRGRIAVTAHTQVILVEAFDATKAAKERVYELIKQFRDPPNDVCVAAGILSPQETWLYDQLCLVIDKLPRT